MNEASRFGSNKLSAAPDFAFGEDDFSIKLSLPEDPMFWWRVEKRSPSEGMLVTDFSPGSQSDTTMAHALARLILSQEVMPREVIFHDLVPSDTDPGTYGLALTKAAQSAQAWCGKACELLGTRIKGEEMSDYRGKARYSVTLECS